MELHGLFIKEGEDTKDEVKKILSKVIPEDVITTHALRFGVKRNYNGNQRNRPIIIKFQSKDQRDKIYMNRSNLKKLEGERLYLNENLPPNLNILKGKANSIRKTKNYKFLWTRNGNILLRKNEQAEVIHIKVPSDLQKLCKYVLVKE